MSDPLPPDLEALFDQDQEEATDLTKLAFDGMAKCSCGNIYSVGFPCYCVCGLPKAYWRDIKGKLCQISGMTLGHLNNTIRLLAAKMESYPVSDRSRFETALEILYAELGSRDKEIQQVTGIMGALTRSLNKAQ